MHFKQFKLTSWLPGFCLLVGIAFSLYLQSSIPEGAFFSGDAGLKALLTQQLSQGHLRFDLISPESDWVQSLWRQGFYPYKEPFVYYLNQRYYITFPYTFPLLTAPFYALFGYRGLYLVPLVATWAVWWSFYWVCRQLQLSHLGTALGLATLIFATPLTLYSAIYWEHSLAVALAFGGFALLLIGTTRPISRLTVGLSGGLIGLASWFRPELFALDALLLLWILATELARLNWPIFSGKLFLLLKLFSRYTDKRLFALCLVVTLLLFCAINQCIYGHPLGIHAIQVVDQLSVPERLRVASQNFGELIVGKNSIFQFLPVFALILLQGIACCLNQRFKFNRRVLLVGGFSVLFILGVALLVPGGSGGKQWGPRFLLFLAPLLCLSVASLFPAQPQAGSLWRRTSNLFLITVVLILGVHQNCWLGPRYLDENYQPIRPIIVGLHQENWPVVVSHQFLAQVFEPTLKGDRLFFRAETTRKLLGLSQTLIARGATPFFYLCYSAHCQKALGAIAPQSLTVNRQPYTLRSLPIRQGDKYSLYRLEWLPAVGSRPI